MIAAPSYIMHAQFPAESGSKNALSSKISLVLDAVNEININGLAKWQCSKFTSSGLVAHLGNHP
jgi:hypothetical protein